MLNVRNKDGDGSLRSWSTRIVLAISLVGGVLSPSQSIAAGRVFYDTFDSGTASIGHVQPATACRVVTTAVDGRAPFRGNYQGECNWDGSKVYPDATYTAFMLPTWTYTREFFVRVFVRYAADVDVVDGAKFLRLYPNTGDSFYLGGMPGRPMFSYFESINGSTGPISYGGDKVFADGNWKRVEVYVKENLPGQTDGVVRVWQDGVIQIDKANIVTVTPNGRWYPLHLMSNWSSNPGWEHDANNHVYWDEIEVYSDAGLGGIGSMSDASIEMDPNRLPQPSPGITPPSAPTAISVQ
jgi:hypothetical protein